MSAIGSLFGGSHPSTPAPPPTFSQAPTDIPAQAGATTGNIGAMSQAQSQLLAQYCPS